MLPIHYLQRCLELAKQGAGYVAPNPMVGAVLVYNDRIISEGWHQQYGKAHAEVNCIESVNEDDSSLISQSTLYVSLEPCVHFGKTPPCTDLIIQHKIPKVVIGCRDPFKEVNGKGIEQLKVAGVEVELTDGLLEYECKKINKRFFTYHNEKRPYIILKWAQTANGKMASPNTSAGGALKSLTDEISFTTADSEISLAGGGGGRLLISNEYSNRLVHQWRSEEAAILIGTNTALLDNPELTNRLWYGNSPIRLLVDMHLRLPDTLKIFNGDRRTIVFNATRQEEKGNLLYYKLEKDKNLIPQLLKALYQLKIQSVLVEGGAMLLQSFIDDGTWDEIRIIHNYSLNIVTGLDAPKPENAILIESEQLYSDTIETYVRANTD